MQKQKSSISDADVALERKIAASKRAIFLERLWPRVWITIGIAAAFLLASIAGLWDLLSPDVHLWVLMGFAGLFGGSLLFAFLAPRAKRGEAISRLEKSSSVSHRPASSFDDTLSSSNDPATRALWHAHKEALAKFVRGLKVAPPRPPTEKSDPFALRAVVVLLIATIFGLGLGHVKDSVLQAFSIQKSKHATARVRIDAWVSPPAYTGKQPLLLSDGGRSLKRDDAPAKDGFVEVPANSTLIVRAAGAAPSGGSSDAQAAPAISLKVQETGKDPVIVAGKAVVTPGGEVAGVREVRFNLGQSARVDLLIGEKSKDHWTFAVTPDHAPVIKLSKKPETSRRGAMKLTYQVKDDYGVASATARVKRAPPAPEDPTTAWARQKDELRGPRLPLARPPELSLRLPRPNAKNDEAVTSLELAEHPWAGLRVIMTLEAVDVAGQTGRSEPFEVVLPQRKFYKRFARALIEQRRKLIEDSRNAPYVKRALEALTLKPERFIEDIQVYLGLRTIIHRLAQGNKSRKTLRSVVDQLWHVAVRIEDGDLSDAERSLKAAQEKLAKALRDGASDEEIQAAMDELRQALNNYLEQLQRQAQDNPLQQQQSDPNGQRMSRQELDRMLQQLEDQALNGSRQQAEQMLSDLRDLLDRIDKNQSTRMSEAERQEFEQSLEQMNELGNMIGQQQQLMDDTFEQQRGQQRSGRQQRGQQSQQGRQGQRGGQQAGRGGPQGQQQGAGQRPGQGRQGGGQRGRSQQPGRFGQGPGQQGSQPGGRALSPQELTQRQRQLAQQLDRLQRGLRGGGQGAKDNLRAAREAMERAGEALSQGDYREAARQQAQALESMRSGAKDMAEELSQGSRSQQAGQQGPSDSMRDPLGRPQRTRGPHLGTSVTVPDEIDMQRAREILQELRERLGETGRSLEELDYFDRLLRRF